ncbi:MAG: purine-binding chemotaxis protein CheW [Thermoprotei archaeon]|nr:purine-binding chemotaxis protein CheW [Thermoprotei archaeon]
MATNERQIVTFFIGNTLCGIDVHQVREVVIFKNCMKLPRAPSFIEGLMNLRGQVVLVINLGKLLDLKDNDDDNNKSKNIIIVDTPGLHIGFLVDQVVGVSRVPSSDIEKAPFTSQGVITGILKLNESLIMIMDAERIINLIRESVGEVQLTVPRTS